MRTRGDELREDIRKVNAQITENDKQIADAERRQELRRTYGDRLYRRLLLLEEQLRREEAPLVRPQPEGVKVGAMNV